MSARFTPPSPYELVESWRPRPDAIGPYMPPMIAWQRAGEPGWPFNHVGRPVLGTINYPNVGENFEFPFEVYR